MSITSVVKRGAVLVCAAGALAMTGVGVASASTVSPELSPAASSTAAHPRYWDRCDDWGHRWDRDCYRNTRWYWHGDGHGHGRWDRWRWDDRRHHWDYR